MATGNPNEDPAIEGLLADSEIFWRDHYHWLLERGYQLRSRYEPNWTPSWKGTKKEWFECSDGLMPSHSSVLDAQRTSDGELLMLKRMEKSVYPQEIEIGQMFSAAPLANDPRNHCVPIYEVLQVPKDEDLFILVMPLLKEHDNPRFDTIGEAVEFFRQIFEGLQFMHKHNVAHRDVTYFNIMMDARPLYQERYHPFRQRHKLDLNGHPKHLTRTLIPVQYYLTDFGLSRKYNPEDCPPMEDIIAGGDKSVPEFMSVDACDPFPVDVYTLGNLIKDNFTHGHKFASARQGFNFMEPLVADMTQTDPSKRPTMDEAMERFEEIRQGLSSWKLRSRVVKKNDSYVAGFFRGVGHWWRRVGFVIKRVPPLPTPTT
ncbi:hypothetical protein BDN71DRAFT_1406986 [Pleurotus eryngii]|uniref:Protein kinase domain-containing protein n=1 Tax=Pleurotus eryngii TaxID=5323 RepID=A0A9P6A8D1_PLEER|nr:hypothetical protein BDN71DRAFT_1406986 [Pleurotus eryngii]